MIGAGFKGISQGRLEDLFQFATNPFVGLLVGILATAFIQSSSTVNSVIVGLVAGGLPVESAIPMVMGADFGTTITNTIVSLGYLGKKNKFKRAFAAATVHDFFNMLAVIIFLPLEIMFHILEKSTALLSVLFIDSQNLSLKGFDFIAVSTKPMLTLFENISLSISPVANNFILILLGIILILLVIIFIGRLLSQLMIGRTKKMLHTTIGKGPLRGILSGTLITIMVQSSSTTTSLIVPFAGAGIFRLKQIYPFTLGATIGTTITALLAATAISGPAAVYALQIALVVMLYNILSVILIYAIPNLRKIPMQAAVMLAKIATKNKLIALLYVIGVFFATPALLVYVSIQL